MKNHCPSCKRELSTLPYTALLAQQFFKLALEKYTFYFLCDACGDRILKEYRNTYGIN